MKIYTSIPDALHHIALTIGFFDGVHLGHQNLIKALCQAGKPATVLTFSNPPWHVFHPNSPLNLLTSFPLKLLLLEKYGVENLIVLPFTLEFATISYDTLLSQFSLSHLVLGEGDAFGAKREGHAANVLPYAKQKGFTVRYLKKTTVDGEIVSSSRIRSSILSKQLDKAERLLGRPHTILFPSNQRQMISHDLCLPPDGTYPVRIDSQMDRLEIKTTQEGRHLSLVHPYPNQILVNFEPTR